MFLSIARNGSLLGLFGYTKKPWKRGLEQLTKTENSVILPVTDHGRLTV